MNEQLTPREVEVAMAVVFDGLPNKAIASKLHMAVKTVEKHRDSIMKKINVAGVANLCRWAFYNLPQPVPIKGACSARSTIWPEEDLRIVARDIRRANGS